MFVCACVLENMWERRKGVYGITPLFSSSFMDFHYHLCALLSEHTRTHTFVHARLIVAFVYRKCDKTCIAFYTAAATTIGHMMGTTTNNIYTNIHSHMFENLFLHPFFEFMCYQTHISYMGIALPFKMNNSNNKIPTSINFLYFCCSCNP